MPHSNGRAKFHSPRPSSGGELSPSDRSVKHASNHPHKTRQSVASHRLSPDVTVAPILPLTLTRPLLAPLPQESCCYPCLHFAASTTADCPEPFKDNTSASNHPRISKHPTNSRLLLVPHFNPRHRSRTPAPRPRNEAPTLSISVDQFRMFGKELALGTATSTL
ncbi:hypothetical protein GWK47_051688 [Chionoecetes opilio]|uniref:Uncharacterized protein n=1 Tax=Chionoecetes opilio TaxID=41210 RepID=A0A8J5CT38_CHIOP|nr:hypothetical protein GWK47_051688 [Chionoecetes opilio]